MMFYCTSTGPIGGLNCEVLPNTVLYINVRDMFVATSNLLVDATDNA